MRVSSTNFAGIASIAILLLASGCSKPGSTSAASADNTSTSSTATTSAPAAAVSLSGDPCAVVNKATDSVNTVDHSTAITTVVAGGAPQSGEARLVGGKSYVQVAGKWHVSPTSAADTAAMLAEVRKSAKQTCQAVGEESLDGVPTAVFTAHVENDGSVSDNKMWVAKGTGLPVKTVSTVEGRTVITQINRYDGVSAPQI
jgi:hypothetical protein